MTTAHGTPTVLTFVTGNDKKLEEMKAFLGSSYEVERKDIDLPELQGDPKEVAMAKVKKAAEMIKKPLIIEDTCLCFNALDGLPGPFIKFFLKALKPEGLYTLLAGFEDKSAYALCTFGFSDGKGKVELFQGRTEGKIVPPRGSREFGWEPCFQPDGFDKTYGEMDVEEKSKISHQAKGLQSLKDGLANYF